jgi:hypothetical protein
MTVAAGCDVNPNINRKTTIVVSCFRNLSLYKNKTKSGKLLKAEELIEEGVRFGYGQKASFSNSWERRV